MEMQTVVVIGDEKNEKLKALVRSFVSEKRYFIFLPLAETYSEMGLLTIENADIVLAAADSINSAKRLAKGYPSEQYDKTVCICAKENMITAWTLKSFYKHAIVCRQGELYQSTRGLLEILAEIDVINLEPIDVLSFCCGGVAEIYYLESEKKLVKQDLANIWNSLNIYSYDALLYVKGDISLSDFQEYADAVRVKDGANMVIGAGYRGGSSVIKVCLIVKKRR